jgi:formylglycine-generating enzyme required for sulfatase activity
MAPVRPDTGVVPLELVWLPGGTFELGGSYGADDERPAHVVTVDVFAISRHEVTNAQYAKFLNEYGQNSVTLVDRKYKLVESYAGGLRQEGKRWAAQTGYENFPVVCVTWFGAAQFCTFYGYSLPTEAQWEFAARGGSSQQFHFGKSAYQLGGYAWFKDNSAHQTHRVGSKKPNQYGLYDMYGNVREWCADWYDKFYYQSSPQHNPAGPEKGMYRSARGGAWSSAAFIARSATRNQDYPNSLSNSCGFRVVQNKP